MDAPIDPVCAPARVKVANRWCGKFFGERRQLQRGRGTNPPVSYTAPSTATDIILADLRDARHLLVFRICK
jgi:hypothetical protein